MRFTNKFYMINKPGVPRNKFGKVLDPIKDWSQESYKLFHINKAISVFNQYKNYKIID